MMIVSHFAATAKEADWVTYPGGDGPGKGKQVVLIAGDATSVSPASSASFNPFHGDDYWLVITNVISNFCLR